MRKLSFFLTKTCNYQCFRVLSGQLSSKSIKLLYFGNFLNIFLTNHKNL